MENIEKRISNLVEDQFPDFYKEQGEVFIQFVKKYYEWLETSQQITTDNSIYYGANVVSKSANITGNGTVFSELFSNNDQIALYKTDEIYYIYNIDQVVNNTLIVLSSNNIPDFSITNTRFDTVKTQYNPLYYARNYYDNSEIDLSAENFILYFKEKYLKNIRFEFNTSKRFFIKHILDLYRSKGSEQAIDLLFKVVFGVGAEIYYPSTDLFRLSSGKWHKPTYLEISLGEVSKQFVNKQIIGTKSGATAFVEAVIRKTLNGKFTDVVYISVLNGNFETGEKINIDGKPINIDLCPAIIGSLNEISLPVTGTGENYRIGDIVNISSQYGRQAKGRIANVITTSGIVNIQLENGGYGYSNSTNVFVSEKVLTIDNIELNANNPSNTEYFLPFEIITQPTANLYYINSTGNFANGDIFTYHANGDLKGVGRVLNTATINSTAGYLTISILSGDMEDNTIYSTANTISANLDSGSGYIDTTSTANIMAWSNSIILHLTNTSSMLTTGEYIYQTNGTAIISNGTVSLISNIVGSNVSVTVSNFKGQFDKTLSIISANTGITANIEKTTIDIGIYDESNSFISTPNNYVICAQTFTNGTVTSISTGSGANFVIDPDLIYGEFIFFNNDNLIDFANVTINAPFYGLSGDVGANLSSVIGTSLGYSNVEIGKISLITNINKGSNYNKPPFITIKEPRTFPFKKQDYLITTKPQTSSFMIGELITQEATNARGLLTLNPNTTHLTMERLRILDENSFVPTTNSTTVIVGESSGAIANIIFVDTNIDSSYLGYNAIINNSISSGNNAVTDIEILDSGFGFSNNEEVTITDNNNISVTGYAVLNKQGTGIGYYKSKDGFLSSIKKLRDGEYFQEYSYEIRSSITLNRYEEMLKQLLHVAGTKYFGALYYDSAIEMILSSESEISEE